MNFASSYCSSCQSCAGLAITDVKEMFQEMRGQPLVHSFVRDMIDTTRVTFAGVAIVAAVFLCFFFLRFRLLEVWLEAMPRALRVADSNLAKYNDYITKAVVNAFLAALIVFVVVKYDVLISYDTIFRVHEIHDEVSLLVHFVYLVQVGYYSYAVYMLYASYSRTSEFIVVFIHHLVAILLLKFSYSNGLQMLGVVVMLLHVFNDLLLSVTKSLTYVKTIRILSLEVLFPLKVVFFLAFSMSWVYTRLYLFFFLVIFPSLHQRHIFHYEGYVPFRYECTSLLLALYTLHVYWFWKIIKAGTYLITHHEVKDTRGGSASSVRTLGAQKEKSQ